MASPTIVLIHGLFGDASSWRPLFGTADRQVAANFHRLRYERPGSTVMEVEGASHFLMLSQPDIVAGVIRKDGPQTCWCEAKGGRVCPRQS
jgi:pimeloyl-ACP methyl ester carboxylesterase